MSDTNVELKGDRGFMIDLNHGKYRIFHNWSKEGQFKCQRYGQNWRDLVGDGMVLALCQMILDPPASNTVDDNLKEMFEAEMSEVQEEQPDEVSHGFLCQLAAERAIETITERIQRLADTRKWGHIEQVNQAFYGG